MTYMYICVNIGYLQDRARFNPLGHCIALGGADVLVQSNQRTAVALISSPSSLSNQIKFMHYRHIAVLQHSMRFCIKHISVGPLPSIALLKPHKY